MTLRLDDYNDHQGLLDKIRYINEAYYKPAAKNIDELEKSGISYSRYSITLRDAYSHLAKIFEYQNIIDVDNKAKITRQLERYLGHLEELLYDTYLKRIKDEEDELFKRLRPGDKPEVKMQLALRLKKVRTVDDNIDVRQRIKDFEEIRDYINNVYSTHQF